MDNQFTILIGGKAGEGVKKSAQVIAEVLCSEGRYTFQMDDYQSLIKGGHNYSVVTSDLEEVFSTYSHADIIICFDQRSIDEHRYKLKDRGILFYNSDESSLDIGIGLPMTSTLKRVLGTAGNVSVTAVTIFCALAGMSVEQLATTITKYYRRDAERNIAFAIEIFRLIPDLKLNIEKNEKLLKQNFLSGNQLIALGAWTSGLDVYYGYPMTPASSILHFLASRQADLNVYAIHAESELAAVNMAIGSSFAGVKSAVGSSGGGFALMQEAFSMAGMAEVPLLCILSSRPGPATGVSTYTAQEDLNFAIHQGHGEFARIVASPDSHERAFSLASELLSLAWELQTPTILLTEKHLSECMKSVLLEPENTVMTVAKAYDLSLDEYDRYNLNDDGVSSLTFPASEAVIKWNSHEHLSSGLRTDRADKMVEMKNKRNRKSTTMIEATKRYERIRTYGDSDRIVFAYGSTVLELREAAKHLDFPILIVAPIYLEPFPIEELQRFWGKEIVVVEHNSTGSFASLLKQKLGIHLKDLILKYDGRPFDPMELAGLLKGAFNA